MLRFPGGGGLVEMGFVLAVGGGASVDASLGLLFVCSAELVGLRPGCSGGGSIAGVSVVVRRRREVVDLWWLSVQSPALILGLGGRWWAP